MREILFRGKRIADGKWVYGVPTQAKDIVTGKIDTVIVENPTGYDFPVSLIDFEFVLSNTISEFTGLTEKSGKKIFEGDIVKDKDGIHKGVVQITGKTFVVRMSEGCWIIDSTDLWDFLGTCADNLTIIGNIYDNSELLGTTHEKAEQSE